jgi:hypothetical protein
MNADQKRALETRLAVMGLKRLDDPALIPQMAAIIQDHEFYMGMLSECEPEKRREMYEALRPHLKFEPWPLENYIAKMKERSAARESWNAPIEVGDQKFQRVDQKHATGVVVDLKCHKCPKTASFYGETMLCAVILARQDGWVREPIIDKEVCPKCPAERGQKKKCPTCTRRHYAPDCRMIASVPERVREKVVIN